MVRGLTAWHCLPLLQSQPKRKHRCFPKALSPLHHTCPDPVWGSGGLFIPWCPAGTVALVSSETVMMGDREGRGGGIGWPGCPYNLSYRDCSNSSCSIKVVSGRGSGGNCGSSNGGCNVGAREVFLGMTVGWGQSRGSVCSSSLDYDNEWILALYPRRARHCSTCC